MVANNLQDVEFLRRINRLRQTDNFTNLFYFAREYLTIALVIGAAVAFYEYRANSGLGWGWSIPVTLLAVVLIGAIQHRLVALGHDGSHGLLFRNRIFNELASDFLCFFPIGSATQLYRMQHLAHHQFTNDPERDPDLNQLETSGHHFDFPMPPGQFLWNCMVRQLSPLGLVRYIRSRAQYVAVGNRAGYPTIAGRSRLLHSLGLVYLVVIAAALAVAVKQGPKWSIWAVAAGLFAVASLFYSSVPANWFRQYHLKPVISSRMTTLGRLGYFTVFFAIAAWLTRITDRPWWAYYLVLWLIPVSTSFSYLMILRQVVQHGNAGRERNNNTRVYLVGAFVRYAVFPLGADYHQPHHMFPMVPHYRLPDLHALLLETQEYRDCVQVVEGYLWHNRPPEHPTVLELMAGPTSEGKVLTESS